jgi:MFS family permease
MQKTTVLTRPAGTSWGSVIGGWLAAVGAAALLAPAIGAILSGRAAVPNDLSLAVPVVLALVVAYLIGGYVAGRMAGYNTSWHGMMTAFLGLFITLIALLLAAAADRGLLATSGVRTLSDVFPGMAQLDLRSLGDVITFGAIFGFLATIFAGWLGGVLAPEQAVMATMATALPAQSVGEVVVSERRVERRPHFRFLPSMGRKGGESAETTDKEVRETRVQR